MRVTPIRTAGDFAAAAQFRRRSGISFVALLLARRQFYAARSATTASSTGNPGMLTRRRPAAVVSTRPFSRSAAIRRTIQRTARQRRVARRIDALGEAKPHEQELVGHFLARQHVVGDEAMPFVLDAREPCLRAFFGRGGMPVAVDIEAGQCLVDHGRPARCRHIRARANKRDCAGIRRPAARDWKSRRPAARAPRRPPASCRKAPARCHRPGP